MTYRVDVGDIMDWPGDGLFSACICDPPYHLVAGCMTRQRPDLVDYDNGKGNPYARVQARGGFMGKTWDGGDVSFRPETWARIAEHLHPGAFLFAFAGARTHHRIACAIEDAGFVIHPTISYLGWVNGAGFPKATRVKGAPEFDGHRYGLQALKPALEPIICAQKPYAGKPVDSIVETGAGALWVDGGRIPSNGNDTNARKDKGNKCAPYREYAVPASIPGTPWDATAGRWPPNFALDEEAAAALDAEVGERPAGTAVRHRGVVAGMYGSALPAGTPDMTYGDTGGPSRFFPRFDYALERLEELELPFKYQAKASRSERNAGCESVPYEWTPGNEPTTHRGDTITVQGPDGLVRRGATGPNRGNVHPTVKPLALARWLATLLLPPDAYAPRRILVPFAGSGSEMIGALLAGWEEIVGVEMEPEYADIARARLAYWAAQPIQDGLL